MGNSLGRRRRTAKVMTIDGETLKFKTPIQVSAILKDHPDHVLMDSDQVRNLGVRAKALDPDYALKPKRLYFLVQLPKLPDQKAPRRVRSGGLNMSARERLESLMLSRRSVSDLSHLKVVAPLGDESQKEDGGVRVRMRVPRAQVAKMMQESKDPAEIAEKIMELCIGNRGEGEEAEAEKEEGGNLLMNHKQWKPSLGSIEEIKNKRKKLGVRFQPTQDGELI